MRVLTNCELFTDLICITAGIFQEIESSGGCTPLCHFRTHHSFIRIRTFIKSEPNFRGKGFQNFLCIADPDLIGFVLCRHPVGDHDHRIYSGFRNQLQFMDLFLQRIRNVSGRDDRYPAGCKFFHFCRNPYPLFQCQLKHLTGLAYCKQTINTIFDVPFNQFLQCRIINLIFFRERGKHYRPDSPGKSFLFHFSSSLFSIREHCSVLLAFKIPQKAVFFS